MKTRGLRRMLLAALLLGALTCVLATGAFAADTIASGTCGEHTAWTLDSDGVLTVTGTGEMNCFMMSPHAPWEEESDKIRSVVIEDGVTSIGKSAFPDCKNLTSVTLPDSLTVVGRYAFANCGALGDVILPDSVTSIGEHAFESCVSMKKIHLPEKLTDLGNNAFQNCTGLTHVALPKGVTRIPARLFDGCTALRTVTIPDGVDSIGEHAFSGCGVLTNVTIPGSVTRIGVVAFGNCEALTNMVIPEGVTELDSNAFCECSGLTRLTLPNSLYAIGQDAFSDCTGLTSVTIPAGVRSTGETLFYGCTNLSTLIFLGEAPSMMKRSLDGITATVYYPNDSTWTEEVRRECAGKLNWVAYDPAHPFTDVAPEAYYEKAVDWAVAQGITNGTSFTKFSPNNACTRGQVVTFLWRMAGKPRAEKRENPFTDVKEGSFCYEAVLWAVEQGITTGKTTTTFCPVETCNRGQIVTFLWRYAGEPEPQNQNRQFADVAAGSFCDQAVMWAVENQITLGMKADTFAPGNPCTRGHAVTFLYRGRELLKK